MERSDESSIAHLRWSVAIVTDPVEGLGIVPGDVDKWALAAPFNLILLAHVASLMARGVKERMLSRVICGAVVLILLAGARYVDLLHSLVVRGVVFVVVGGVLFAEGIFYARGSRLEEEGDA